MTHKSGVRRKVIFDEALAAAAAVRWRWDVHRCPLQDLLCDSTWAIAPEIAGASTVINVSSSGNGRYI